MLSDDQKHWAVAEASHGTVVSWARKAGVFGRTEFNVDVDDLQVPQLEEQWIRWAREEELVRITSCLYIHDAELAHTPASPRCNHTKELRRRMIFRNF
jgi:hypothetical protein